MPRDDEQRDDPVLDDAHGATDAGEADEIDPDSVPTVIDRALVEPIERPERLERLERRGAADPMDRAKSALRAARLARGIDPDAVDDEPEPLPEPDSGDPFARAQSALERAAAARAEAAQGRRALERENRAREELQRLKGAPAPTATPAKGDAEPPKPKKRRL